MRYAVAASVLLLGFAYQWVALPLYRLDSPLWGGGVGVGPDFVLAAICVLAVRSPTAVALVAAAVGGAVFEAISLDPWGARAPGYLLSAWFLSRARLFGVTAAFVPRAGVVLALGGSAVVASEAIAFVGGGAAALSGWGAGAASALYSALVCVACVEASAPLREVLSGMRSGSEYSLRVPGAIS